MGVIRSKAAKTLELDKRCEWRAVAYRRLELGVEWTSERVSERVSECVCVSSARS